MKTITYDENKWKLVPIEPTEEMILKGIEEWDTRCNWPSLVTKIYRAMIAAAPPADQEG